MGSIGTGEIMVILFVALIVFGPQRLPEIARKAGELLAKARQMTQTVTDTIDAEYGDVAAPIKDLKSEYDATKRDMKGIASSMMDMSVDLPKVDWKAEGGRNETNDDPGDPGDPVPPTSNDEAS